jgi:hypothetical protein
MNSRNGISLAVFLTFIIVWVTSQFGVPVWVAWNDRPVKRIGILLLADGLSASLTNAWGGITGLTHSTAIRCLWLTENADV